MKILASPRRGDSSQTNAAVARRVRTERKSSSKVSTTAELLEKLEAAREKVKEKESSKVTSSLLDRILAKGPNQGLKSTSPSKWTVNQVDVSPKPKRSSEEHSVSSSKKRKSSHCLSLLNPDAAEEDLEAEEVPGELLPKQSHRRALSFSPVKDVLSPADTAGKC